MALEIITIEKTELVDLIDSTVRRAMQDIEPPPVIPEIMTKAELADYLRCDVSKINRYMTSGLPFLQFGGHPRFRRSAVDKWLDGGVQALQREESKAA